MKLKFYLRGLGIGIIVTAILMGIATKDKAEMTDEEIKARATELGMVEQRVLADVTNTPVPEATEAPVVTAPPEMTEEPQVTLEPTAEPESTDEPEPTPQPTETPKPTEQPEDERQTENTTITLVIESGETSWSISKNLYEMGLVESASEFDSYLCQNGYDKTIRIGEYHIPADATYEEIAKLIAR